MPPSHPREEWNVTTRDHPGSERDEIEREPDWGSVGHGHYPGFKNRQGRRPGHTAWDEHTGDLDEVPTDLLPHVVDRFEQTLEAVKEGHLVNWQEAIATQQVRCPPQLIADPICCMLTMLRRTCRCIIQREDRSGGVMSWITPKRT